MSKRLLIITQKVDETDDLLGFFVSWIREFEKHFDRVDVIALKPGISKFQQALRMVRLLWRDTPREGVVFCHMSPIFAIIAWPFARLRHSRLVLWYLHRSTTLRLRLALHLVDTLVTADAASLTITSPKIVSVGHGIDIRRFTTVRDWSGIHDRPLRILSVGRLAPIKDFITLIRAAAILWEQKRPIQVRIVGRALQPVHDEYERRLRNLVQELNLDNIVSFVGFVPYRQMPGQYEWADVVVGGTPRGGIDKALLEAMASGCIVITSNDVMRTYLEPYADRLLYPHGDSQALARSIAGLTEYAPISTAMVANVKKYHTLSDTITRITHLV